MQRIEQKLFILFLSMVFILSCEKDSTIPFSYKTRQVIIIVIDGARYSETWGDPTHQYIPRLTNQLSNNGIVNTRFYNNGPTFTIAGHTAIMTGKYQEINNEGLELPQYSSIFQHWLQTYNKGNSAAWVIASKDKLKVLSDCKDPEWKGKHNPTINCGIQGLGSGYRDDSVTYDKVIQFLSAYHPRMVLISFGEPDISAHNNSWSNYTKGILDTDEYVYKLRNFIENEPFYMGSTTMFVTNDHGRHLDSIAGGFISHGDNCEGCRHINLFACGPDFKEDSIIATERELIDIPATIAHLLDFKIPNCNGKVMYELFK